MYHEVANVESVIFKLLLVYTSSFVNVESGNEEYETGSDEGVDVKCVASGVVVETVVVCES